MSDQTTTIEITQEQRDYLRTVNPGSAKAALQELIDGRESSEDDYPRLGYDDVVAASRQALREELPQGALQG